MDKPMKAHLHDHERVVTHAGMKKRITSNRLTLVAVVAILGFLFYQKVSEDHRLAVKTGDYSLCWTDACKSDVSYGYYLR